MPMMIRGTAAFLFAAMSAASAASPQQCFPVLAFKDIKFSPMQPPTLDRKWTAIVSVDASQCQTNSSGHFDIVFTRLSENAPDLEFKERFAWRPPEVEITVNFSATEAVQNYRIVNITGCECLK